GAIDCPADDAGYCARPIRIDRSRGKVLKLKSYSQDRFVQNQRVPGEPRKAGTLAVDKILAIYREPDDPELFRIVALGGGDEGLVTYRRVELQNQDLPISSGLGDGERSIALHHVDEYV